MKRFQVRWTQYILSGNHFFDIEDRTQVQCQFETPIYAKNAIEAKKRIVKLFGYPKILSIDEFSEATKVGWF